MSELSVEQQQQITDLEDWFAKEVAELNRRQLAIMQEYDAKKIAVLKQHISDHGR